MQGGEVELPLHNLISIGDIATGVFQQAQRIDAQVYLRLQWVKPVVRGKISRMEVSPSAFSHKSRFAIV